jgi:hypothetical protein
MNIFVLDEDPWTAAIWVCDRHSVKMPLESAQLLCTALASHGVLNTPYTPTHKNHPCTKWAALTRGNFDWLCMHGFALCKTYQLRYGKTHKCLEVIEWCESMRYLIPEGDLTPWSVCMADEYKVGADVVASYRKYYCEGKSYMNKGNGPQWAKNPMGKPHWFNFITPNT